MTLKNFLNWFRFSGVWAGVVVNPYHWEPDIKFDTQTQDEQYGLFFFELNLGIVWIRIIVDDGRW